MSRTVLLVDDEAQILSGLKRVLKSEPYSVVTATSAADGLRILARRKIDVLVVDEQMPGMRGSEMLAQVQRDFPQVRKIVLTGHANLDAALYAINAGRVFKFLEKPIDSAELQDAIQSALDEQPSRSA